jgi:LPXTG-motif cell wall-anchored protein
MSGHIGGQSRALPFTGLTSGPFVILGLLLSAIGFVMTQLRRNEA